MKQYDLQPDPELSPIIGLLHSMVTYNYQRLNRLIAGLSQQQIDFKGHNNEFNSIAQLLRHLAVVDLHWVYRLQSKDVPVEYKAQFGPMYDSDGKLPLINDISLQVLLDEYELIQKMLREVCKNLSEKDLTRVIPFENGNTATIQWGIWHVADHSRHHYSNIVQIKKMF